MINDSRGERGNQFKRVEWKRFMTGEGNRFKRGEGSRFKRGERKRYKRGWDGQCCTRTGCIMYNDAHR